METYLVYRIDKGLGIVPGEALNHLDFITVGEDRRNQ